MKYIKTEDGIFAFEGVNTITKVYETPKGIKPWSYSDGTLVKEGDKFIHVNNKDYNVDKENTADTIEELCDEFVLKCNGLIFPGVLPKRTDFNDCKDLSKKNYANFNKHNEVYGAIWTDKGLIYIAKMNDKGELELL